MARSMHSGARWVWGGRCGRGFAVAPAVPGPLTLRRSMWSRHPREGRTLDTMSTQKDRARTKATIWMVASIIVCGGVGAAVGIALGLIGMGVGVGVAIGAVIGFIGGAPTAETPSAGVSAAGGPGVGASGVVAPGVVAPGVGQNATE